jgi:hypothetical protein
VLALVLVQGLVELPDYTSQACLIPRQVGLTARIARITARVALLFQLCGSCYQSLFHSRRLLSPRANMSSSQARAASNSPMLPPPYRSESPQTKLEGLSELRETSPKTSVASSESIAPSSLANAPPRTTKPVQQSSPEPLVTPL